MQEKRLDHLGLVTEAEDETLKAVARISSHDVPEDRPIADRHHRLGAELGLLADARSQAAAEHEDGHVSEILTHVNSDLATDERRW